MSKIERLEISEALFMIVVGLTYYAALWIEVNRMVQVEPFRYFKPPSLWLDFVTGIPLALGPFVLLPIWPIIGLGLLFKILWRKFFC